MIFRVFDPPEDGVRVASHTHPPHPRVARGRAFAVVMGISLLVVLAPFHVAAQESPQAAGVESTGGIVDEPERQDLSFKLPEGQAVDVDNPYGSVYVRFGGYEHQLDIHTTVQQPKGAATIAFAPREEGGRFRVVPTLPQGVALAEGQRIDLVVYVP